MESIPSFSEGNLVRHDLRSNHEVGRVLMIRGDEARVAFAGAQPTWECITSLVRHVYPDGTILRSNSVGGNGTVMRSRVSNGTTSYWMRFGDESATRRLSERDIDLTPVPTDALSLLEQGRFHDVTAFSLAIQARQLLYSYSYDELVSLSNARIELYPHQVFVAHRVLQFTPPRFLLSDEVGLGKTIEAGLIIKELRARGAANRVLIVTPSGLVPQWVSELGQKFNEPFTRIDSVTLGGLLADRTPDQIWSEHASIVTSLHLLRAHPDYVDRLADQSWDLIIFDEAHHLRRMRRGGQGNDISTTEAYRLAEQLRSSTDALLLLTATPLQIDPFELYALLDLLDPTLFPDYAEFERYRQQIPALNRMIQQLDGFDALPEADQLKLAKDIQSLVSGNHRQRNLDMDTVRESLHLGGQERQQIAELIADQHRLSAVMIRNRKRVVFENLQPRRANMIQLEYSEAERTAYDQATRYLEDAYDLAMERQDLALGFVMVTYRKMLTSSAHTLRRSLERRIEKLEQLTTARRLLDREDGGDSLNVDDEQELDVLLKRHDNAVYNASPEGLALEIAELRRLCGYLSAVRTETKATSLRDVLAHVLAEQDEKVLIFTQFTETMSFLQELFRDDYRVVTFHGGMNSKDKDRAIDEFRSPGGAQVMIATEAAGEGRNLQFCHVMVNYDLPWNPMKVEQRIGRLDRIGQKRPVEIYNFAVTDTLEDRILTRLLQRIGIFENTVGFLDPILGPFERDFESLLLRRRASSSHDHAELEKQIDQIETKVRRAQEMEEKLEDFILDQRSFRKDEADALLNRKPTFSGSDLKRFVERLFTHLGGSVQESRSGVVELRAPRRLHEIADGNLRDAYRATFDPAIALQRDELDFVAFGHEVLDAAIKLCVSPGFDGKSALLAIESDALDPGIAFCAVFEESLTGVKPRQQLRFVAVDLDGHVLPDMSDAFPALVPFATPWVPDAEKLARFREALDLCNDAAEDWSAARLRDLEVELEKENLATYERELQKQDRFYAVKLASEARNIERLQNVLRTQRESSELNDRKVAPLTQGRLDGAIRRRSQLHEAQSVARAKLDGARSVSSSSQLLAAGWVRIQPSSQGRSA